MKHALKFHCELESALDLELGKHATFCIIRDRAIKKQALREVSFIISFKNILFCDKPEKGYGLIEDHLDFGVRFLGRYDHEMLRT
jgi:hypothetical protein